MVMKFFAICFHALLVLGSAILSLLATADVSGTWAGSIDVRTTGGQSNRVAIYLRLNQAGTEVTGTFGPTRDKQYRIEKGTIDGGVLAFQVAAPTRVARVTLRIVDGGRMQGEVATDDGRVYGEMSLAREAGTGRVGRVGRVGSWKL